MQTSKIQAVFKEAAQLEKTVLEAHLGKYMIPLTIDTGESLLLALTEKPVRDEERGFLKIRAKIRDQTKCLHYLELTFDFSTGLAWGTRTHNAHH